MSQFPAEASSADAPPVCPRHPERVSYVRCQRCDRPACPSCQVPGAVGVHCVDCVRSAQASRRAPRTVLGGGMVADALLTRLLVGACVLAFMAQHVLPSVTSALLFSPVVALSEPWRFLSTAFLHSGVMHLAFNMWALWVTGTMLEPLLGRWRFGALYTLSALGGSVMVYVLASPSDMSWLTGTVGASGAVFGLFAAVFVIQRRFGRDTSAILGLLGVNLVISFMAASISWQGHLGGLLTGGALAALFAWAPRERRRTVGLWGPVLIAVLLAAAVWIKALVS